MNVYGNELLVHKSKVSLGLGIKQRNWFVFFFSLDFITCERFVMNCLALCFEWRVLFYLFIFWFIFFSRFSFSYLCFMVSFESLWMSDNFFMVSIYLSWIVLVILRLESIFIPLKTVNFDGWNFEENAIFEFKIFAKRNAFKNWRKKHFFFLMIQYSVHWCFLVLFAILCCSHRLLSSFYVSSFKIHVSYKIVYVSYSHHSIGFHVNKNSLKRWKNPQEMFITRIDPPLKSIKCCVISIIAFNLLFDRQLQAPYSLKRPSKRDSLSKWIIVMALRWA